MHEKQLAQKLDVILDRFDHLYDALEDFRDAYEFTSEDTRKITNALALAWARLNGMRQRVKGVPRRHERTEPQP